MRTNRLFVILCVGVLTLGFPAMLQSGALSLAQENQSHDKIDAPAAVQLQPVFSGLSGTVFLTHAHDGTNRLFVIEQIGRIRVAQPGASTTTVFLDIVSRVLSGGERGLLGLAFHPQYSINGRFFVNYTRQTDGATVIAEYHVSAGNPNVADLTETVLLTINQPFSNHNGGMIEFGPDGYLYIGMGDGGSANDPGNRAQNLADLSGREELLGKMLRIDVDIPNGPAQYSSPSSNPFFGGSTHDDEIYAYGLRNPWRWSFDRTTGQLYAGDVGQNVREEINIVTLGGNYGWRVMEGMICNPSFNGGVCTPPSGSLLPIFDYVHTAGRCSITGGYVYRGSRGTVPTGAYVYADYCTGEIWQLLGGVNTPLLDLSFNITSFGEDEAGEVYVVGQNGTISRLATVPAPPPCMYLISPTSQLFPSAAIAGTLGLATASDCGWLAAANVEWITFIDDQGTGSDDVSFVVKENQTGSPRTGIVHAGGQTFTVVQEGSAAPDCVFGIAPLFQSFSSAGGQGSFSLFTEERCAWEATPSHPAWITVTSASVGIGNALVTFAVASNTSGSVRKGNINVGGQLFTVKQKR